MKINYATISKTGRRRNNEDALRVVDPKDGNRFMALVCDRILVCSDGLYKSMPPEILKERMMDDKPLADILDVYDFLCYKNGDDNYTAVLIEVWD